MLRPMTLLGLFTVGVALGGCQKAEPDQVTLVDSGCSSGASSGSALTQSGDPTQEISFYKDILPIYESRQGDEAYKCLTCHEEYKDPGASNSRADMELILNNVDPELATEEPTPMPPGEIVMKRKHIETLRLWGETGFTTGDPEDTGLPRFEPDVPETADESAQGSLDSDGEGAGSPATDCTNESSPSESAAP